MIFKKDINKIWIVIDKLNDIKFKMEFDGNANGKNQIFNLFSNNNK